MAAEGRSSRGGALARRARSDRLGPRGVLGIACKTVVLGGVLFLTSCMLCPPGLYLWKAATPVAGNLPGRTVVYTLTYRNTTDSPVSATIVDDHDQAHGSPQAIGGSPHFAPGVANGDTITWGPAVVPPGGTGTLSYEFALAGLLAFDPGTSHVRNVATFGGVVAEATVEVVRPGPPGPAGGGRLVVLADDWPLGNYFSRTGSDAGRFILNVLEWLTEPMSGPRNTLLLDAGYLGHGNVTDLAQFLVAHGYTGDVVDTRDWTPELLAHFAVVIVERGTGSWYIPVLTDYLRAGHGVLLVGGSDAPEVPDWHNAFLRQFGIEFQPHTVVSEDTLRAFASHPITAGVDTLYVLNPTPITVLGPGPVVLCQQYDDPWPLPGEPQTLIWLVALDLP